MQKIVLSWYSGPGYYDVVCVEYDSIEKFYVEFTEAVQKYYNQFVDYAVYRKCECPPTEQYVCGIEWNMREFIINEAWYSSVGGYELNLPEIQLLEDWWIDKINTNRHAPQGTA